MSYQPHPLLYELGHKCRGFLSCDSGDSLIIQLGSCAFVVAHLPFLVVAYCCSLVIIILNLGRSRLGFLHILDLLNTSHRYLSSMTVCWVLLTCVPLAGLCSTDRLLRSRPQRCAHGPVCHRTAVCPHPNHEPKALMPNRMQMFSKRLHFGQYIGAIAILFAMWSVACFKSCLLSA